MFLAHTMRVSQVLRGPWLSIEFGIVCAIPHFCLSRLYSLINIRLLEAKNSLAPFTAPTRSMLACSKLRYLLLDDVTGSCSPIMALLTDVVLKVPTMGGRYFEFLKKIWGKKVSQRRFSPPANAYPVSFVMRCKNIRSSYTKQTTTV